ncbi:retrotransposon protein, putative, ty1-copia subclass [Tanacetum coccineum]
MEWYRNLWIVLSVEDKLPFLEQPIPTLLVPAEGQVLPPDVLNTHTTYVKASKEIAGLMLMTMDLDIQKNLEHLGVYDMLKMLYAQQANQELLQTVREFHACKPEEGQSISSYVLKMKSYIDNLECLGHAITQNLSISLILVLLRKEYDGFVQNYNMHNIGKTVTELHAMLKLHEQTLPLKEVAPALYAIRVGRIQKTQKKKSYKAAKRNQGKGKAKMSYALVPALPFAPKPKNPPTPKKDNPAKDAICHQCGEVGHWRRNCPIYLVELMKKKKLSQGASTTGSLVSRLYKDGFVNRFENVNSISISRNNLIYFNAIPRDDIYEIVLSSSNTNDSSMYDVSNKRAKPNLDSTLLWHCRLGHINKKRMVKLQHDGLLNSTDIKSLEKCVSCMSGKMARKPYSYQVKRAKDLLRLIHTNVCVPFKIMSRQGAYYFVTFTDDFSQYGYVYLLKHKHEVFKLLNQEFLDHLKDHGIISHRTPPYTPQMNGVSERRNQTLLDMVQSMMSQTTLPKSFWDYALEFGTCILNMVPTKKVDKTPYENKVFVTRNAEFFKNDIMNQESSGSLEDLEIIQEEDTHPSIDTSLNNEEDDQEINEPQSDINPICRYTRKRRALDRMCLYIDAEEHKLGDLSKPANYKAALLDPESDKWLSAMNVEMQSMKDNEVWELVDLHPNGKTIDHKWIFKKKTNMDGAVHTYKACLVAKGFTQTPGIDYKETFSPIADIRAIRILIAIAAFYNYEIWQMDVKTAFLNGYLNKEVYMEQPEGFVSQKFPNRSNRDEPCVYVKASGSYVTFLILYVDDILLMGNNIPMLQDVKSYLGRCFAIKDLGEAAYILEIKIYRDRSKQLISLCQSAYIEKILKRFYMENSKRGTISMQEKLKFSKSHGALTPAEIQCMQNIPYASSIGSIMYAVRCTRPDVAFAKNITSRFQQNPELRVSCYIDAGYLTDADDMKSQTGYVFILNGEAVWICKFISGLGVVPIIKKLINMYCDNTRAIAIEKDHGVTKGARHFRAKVHYLRETIEMGDVKIEKVDTYDNLADPFTKALAFPKHSELTKKTGMIPDSSLM